MSKKLYLISGFFLGTLFNYLYVLLINKSFGIEVYGKFTLYFISVKLITLLIVFGQDLFLIKHSSTFSFSRGPQLRKSDKLIFETFMYWILGLIILSILVFGILFIRNKPIVLFLFTLVTIFPNAIIRILNTINKINFNVITFVYLEYISVPLFSTLILLLFRNTDIIPNHLNPAIIAYSFATLFTFLIISISFKNIIATLRINRQIKFNLKNQISQSFPFIATASISFISIYIDQYIISFYLGNKDLGIYDIYFKLAQVSSLPLIALNNYSAPKISQLFKSNNIFQLKRFLTRITFLGILISVPITLFVLSNSKFLLNLFNLQELNGSLLPILLLGQFLNYTVGPIGFLFQMTNHQKEFLFFAIFAIVLGLILNILFIPLYGLLAPALTSVITMFLINIIPFIYFKKTHNYTTINLL